MRMYRVIYDAIDEIEAAMKGMLAPKFRRRSSATPRSADLQGLRRGHRRRLLRQDGKITARLPGVRVVRDGIVIHEGQLGSLQRFKDAVKEVAAGYECGMTIEKFNDIKEGDIIECLTSWSRSGCNDDDWVSGRTALAP